MSTSPDVEFTQIPGGFAATRLTVVSDERVQSAADEARGLGYAAGYAAGARAAAAETEALREKLERESAELHAQMTEASKQSRESFVTAVRATQNRILPILDDSRELLYSLALELASVALGVEVLRPSEAIEGVTVGALAALHRALSTDHDIAVTKIRMNPHDAELIRAQWDVVCQELGDRCAEVEIVSDGSLSVGDAVAEFEDGFLDARLSTAMDRARVALDAELEALKIARQAARSGFDAASVGIPNDSGSA